MNRTFRTIFVPLASVPDFMTVAAAVGPATLSDAWTALAGPDATIATHQITSGLVAESLIPALASVPGIDVSTQDADAALARLELVLTQQSQ